MFWVLDYFWENFAVWVFWKAIVNFFVFLSISIILTRKMPWLLYDMFNHFVTNSPLKRIFLWVVESFFFSFKDMVIIYIKFGISCIYVTNSFFKLLLPQSSEFIKEIDWLMKRRQLQRAIRSQKDALEIKPN